MYGSKIPFKKTRSLPKGWMFAIVESGDLNGGSVEFQRFLSPDGHIFQSRALAIRFMIDNNHSQNDIECMKALFISEDHWMVDKRLPEGWMKKELKASPAIYLSPTFEVIKFKVHVLEFMRKKEYSKEVIEKVEKYLYENKNMAFSKKPNKTDEQSDLIPLPKKAHLDQEVIDWKSGDRNLPENWLIGRKSD